MGSAQWHYNIGIFSFRFHRFTPRSTKTFEQAQSRLKLTNITRSTASFRQQRKHLCAENFLHSPRGIFNIHSAHRKKYLKFNLWRGESVSIKKVFSENTTLTPGLATPLAGNASYSVNKKSAPNTARFRDFSQQQFYFIFKFGIRGFTSTSSSDFTISSVPRLYF